MGSPARRRPGGAFCCVLLAGPPTGPARCCWLILGLFILSNQLRMLFLLEGVLLPQNPLSVAAPKGGTTRGFNCVRAEETIGSIFLT